MSLAVLDSGVIAEYVNVAGEFNAQSRAIFESIDRGEFRAIVVPATISELYYVLRRMYEGLRMREADRISRLFCEYIYYHPGVEVVEMSLGLLVEAGRIKHAYRLALTDCYVLAASKLYGCRVVFRHREAEMRAVLDSLCKEFQIVFLEDYV